MFEYRALCEKEVYMNLCNSAWFSELELLEPAGQIKLNVCLYGWIKGEVRKINIDIPDELLARFMDAAARLKKREDQLRRTTHDIRTPVAKCAEGDGGTVEHLL